MADNEFIVGTGAGVYAHESGATVRTSLGLGTTDNVTFAQLDVKAIEAADSSLDINGLDVAQGGVVNITGGTSSTSNKSGGNTTMAGGTPGATGVGGSANLEGASGGSTSGAGGAANVVGGRGI
ncbi:hypothetical protein LCGC14_1890590, partial [marine sediment metagenome]